MATRSTSLSSTSMRIRMSRSGTESWPFRRSASSPAVRWSSRLSAQSRRPRSCANYPNSSPSPAPAPSPAAPSHFPAAPYKTHPPWGFCPPADVRSLSSGLGRANPVSVDNSLASGSHRSQRPLRRHRPQQPFQRHLHVLPPGKRRLQLQPQPGETQVRPNRLEPHGEQVLGWENARGLLPFQVAERLYRLGAAPSQILRHALDQDPAEPAAAELVQHMRRREQDRVGADRAGWKGDGPRHVERRGIQHVSRGHAVDVNDLPAAAPLEQH